MRSTARILTVAGLLIAVVVIGIALGWFATRGPSQKGEPVTTNRTTAPADQVQVHTPVISSAPPPSVVTQTSVTPVARPATNGPPIAPAATNLLADWEDRLDSILGSEGDERGKARQLLQIFPRLPADGQAEVAGHLSNLVEDQDYDPLKKLLLDPALPEEVLDVLIADILNRPNALKLPALLEVARNDRHPKAGEARDVLELYLEENYGADWPRWQAAVDKWLKDNPD